MSILTAEITDEAVLIEIERRLARLEDALEDVDMRLAGQQAAWQNNTGTGYPDGSKYEVIDGIRELRKNLDESFQAISEDLSQLIAYVRQSRTRRSS